MNKLIAATYAALFMTVCFVTWNMYLLGPRQVHARPIQPAPCILYCSQISYAIYSPPAGDESLMIQCSLSCGSSQLNHGDNNCGAYAVFPVGLTDNQTGTVILTDEKSSFSPLYCGQETPRTASFGLPAGGWGKLQIPSPCVWTGMCDVYDSNGTLKASIEVSVEGPCL